MTTSTYEDILRSAKQLPPEEQDQLIQELQDARRQSVEDARWDTAFERSQDKLEQAAARVRANRAAGRRIPLDADRS